LPSGTAATRSAPGPGGLAGQLIAATILGCGALMLAGFAVNLGAAVWSATAVAVLAWLAIPVWVLALGRTLARSRSVLPETESAAGSGRGREARA
jgi:Flp pilus assembly protein TadB